MVKIELHLHFSIMFFMRTMIMMMMMAMMMILYDNFGLVWNKFSLLVVMEWIGVAEAGFGLEERSLHMVCSGRRVRVTELHPPFSLVSNFSFILGLSREPKTHTVGSWKRGSGGSRGQKTLSLSLPIP